MWCGVREERLFLEPSPRPFYAPEGTPSFGRGGILVRGLILARRGVLVMRNGYRQR